MNNFLFFSHIKHYNIYIYLTQGFYNVAKDFPTILVPIFNIYMNKAHYNYTYTNRRTIIRIYFGSGQLNRLTKHCIYM